MGCQLVSVLVLSRLLTPGDFGLVIMCAPVITFLGMFQSLGLLQATVQRPSIDHAHVNFLFWINVAASVAVAVVLLLGAPLVAAFYHEPRVGPLVAAMALPMLMAGISAQHSALLTRRMRFGWLAFLDAFGAVTTLVGSIAWALIQSSYWALFAGTLIGATLTTLATWLVSRWRPGLPRRVPGGWDMLRFGAGITGFSFANFFARNLDNILIGRYWGGVQLGLYDRAYKLLLFPLTQIANPLSRVMVPALSRITSEPDRYRTAYLRVLRLTLLVTLPGVAWGTAMADTLIPLALGSQWAGSAPIFAALGFAGLVQPLNNPAGWLFISQGRGREYAIWGIWTAAFAIAAFGVGIFYGAVGVAVAYSISEYMKTPILWWYIGRKGPVRTRDIVTQTGPLLLGAHVAIVAVWFGRDLLPGMPIAALGLALLLSYAIATAVAALFGGGRAALADAADLVLRYLQRSSTATTHRPAS
jgi:polysaccharide transporter, PST family